MRKLLVSLIFFSLVSVGFAQSNNLAGHGSVNNGGGSSSGGGSSGSATFSVANFNGSGSAATCSGTIAASTTALSVSGCSPSNDFQNSQWVLIPQAGPAALSTTANPTVTGHGTFTAGAQTWTYQVSYVDRWGGVKAAQAAVSLTTGQTAADGVNYPIITLGTQSYSYCDVAVWRTAAPAGIPTGLIGFTAGCGTGTVLQDTNLPIQTSLIVPTTPPVADLNQFLVAQIAGGGGTPNITIGTAASSVAPGTAVTIIHDNTQPFQNTVAAILAAGGGYLYVPNGTWHVDQGSFWTGSAWNYTNPTTTATPANEQLGLVHLISDLTIEGADWAATVIDNPYHASSHNSIFASANPTATRIPGAVCNSGAWNDFVKKPINNVSRGQTYVVTTTASDAGTFSIGDIVNTSGGVVSGNVSCNATSINEPNVITGIDSTNGNIQLAYPVSAELPWGTAGTAPFITKLNNWYFKNITIRNLTLKSTGGGARLSLSSVIRARVDHVKLLGPAWYTTFNISGARDLQFVNSYFHIYANEEMDQFLDLTIDNNTLIMNDGGAQLSFDNGADGLRITNNIITANDFYSGLGGRAGAVTVINMPCINDVTIDNNQIDSSSANASNNTIFVMGSTCAATGEPRPFNWNITRNKIKQSVPNGTGGILAINSSAMDKLLVADNQVYTTGTSNGDLSLYSGLVTRNQIEDAGTVASALINITNTTGTTTIPIDVVDNTIKSTSGVCIKSNSTQTTPVIIGVNRCETSGNPVLVLNSGAPLYIEAQVGGGAYNPTTISRAFKCPHGMSLPAVNTGGGAVTAGGTDCNFIVTGGTAASTNQVNFALPFGVAPVCNCAPQATGAITLVTPVTGSVTVTPTGTAFACSCY